MYTRLQEIILALLVLILILFAVTGTTDTANPPSLFTKAEEYFRIDLNKADGRELDFIPGIGPVLAHRLIEYRKTHGRIQQIQDLLNIKGFSPRIIEKMKRYVVLSTQGNKD